MSACYLHAGVGPAFHVRKFGPHVHQRGEYGLLPHPLNSSNTTWRGDFPHVTLPSLLLIRHLAPLPQSETATCSCWLFSVKATPNLLFHFVLHFYFRSKIRKSIKIFSVVTVFKEFGLDASCGGGVHIW